MLSNFVRLKKNSLKNYNYLYIHRGEKKKQNNNDIQVSRTGNYLFPKALISLPTSNIHPPWLLSRRHWQHSRNTGHRSQNAERLACWPGIAAPSSEDSLTLAYGRRHMTATGVCFSLEVVLWRTHPCTGDKRTTTSRGSRLIWQIYPPSSCRE